MEAAGAGKVPFKAMKILTSLQPLFPYLRSHRKQYALGFLTLLAEVCFWVAVPQIIRFAIDDLRRETSAEKLAIYSGLLVGAALCKGFFLFWTRMILIGISRNIECDLRNDLYRHLTKLSLGYFQRTRTGDIMSRATNDLNAVRMLLGPGVMYSARTTVIMIAALVVMMQISTRLTLYCFSLVPVVAFVVVEFGGRIHHRFEAIQAMMSDMSARVQESLAGMRVLRAYVQEEADLQGFLHLNTEYVERNRRLIRVWGMFYPTLEILTGLIAVTVLWAGGREVAQGNISIGSFVAFNVYMAQLTWPMIALGWVVNLHQRGTASLARLNHILEERPEIDDAAGLPSLPTLPALAEVRGNEPGALPGAGGNGGESSPVEIAGGIPVGMPGGIKVELRNLSFAYNGTQVLRNINLTIPAGSTLAIVGPTGSGKSTLASLLPRLFDAAPGMVWLDGHPVRHFRLQDLRRMIGFVPQETFLFSDSLRENIAFGVEQASDDEIARAAGIAGLLNDVEEFPRGFKTIVGERGITLSGGQKQRTAIARAVLRNPRLLILDDALSSVDTYTEEMILNRMQTVLQGRTSILISHRISTVRGADQIIVLVNGKIAERGSHEKLMEKGSYYTQLYRQQLLEEELERD